MLKPCWSLLLPALALLAGCAAPRPMILFAVAAGQPIATAEPGVTVQRGDQRIPGVRDVELQSGDVVEIAAGVDGTGLRTFTTITTVHGPATLRVADNEVEQRSGTALHEANGGRLLVPGLAIDHDKSVYVIGIADTTIELIVLDGRILVTPTEPTATWKPFAVDSRQERRIWRDGRLSPNRPLGPDDLNRWIDAENRLLAAGGMRDRLVPSLMTLPIADAKGVIEASQFGINHRFATEGDGELGTVTAQEPVPGRRVAAKGTVVVFERSRPVRVPTVTGLSLGLAQDRLRDVGLEGHEAGRTITGAVKFHEVNAQQPAPGELIGAGTSVALTVEAVSVLVPDVTGKPVDEARTILGNVAGGLALNVASTNYQQGRSGPDIVDAQHVAANTRVAPGTVVGVTRRTVGFVVPNVVGLSSSAALARIQAAQLPVGETRQHPSAEVAVDIVLAQTPPAGVVSGRDVPVVLEISSGPRSK